MTSVGTCAFIYNKLHYFMKNNSHTIVQLSLQEMKSTVERHKQNLQIGLVPSSRFSRPTLSSAARMTFHPEMHIQHQDINAGNKLPDVSMQITVVFRHLTGMSGVTSSVYVVQSHHVTTVSLLNFLLVSWTTKCIIPLLLLIYIIRYH